MSKTDETEPHGGVQGEGGAGGVEGRQDAGGAGAVFRCASQPDHGLEEPVAGRGRRAVFGPDGARQEPAVDVKTLHAKIGELTLENDFLEGALTKAGMLSAKR